MYGRALVMANWKAHWKSAEKVPEKLRSAPGKISAETIHGMPFRPKDQLLFYYRPCQRTTLICLG